MEDKADKQEPHEPSHSWLEKIAANILMPHNKEDFLSLVDLAVKKGTIEPQARDMIQGVMEVSETQVRDIMIPRTQMVTLNIEMSQQEILNGVVSSAHTRLPVFNEERDDIIGILHAKDMLQFFHLSTPFDKNTFIKALRPAVFVPESKKLDALLRDFKSGHNHLAIVVDEYGAIAGLITIEDILEEIVGDIEDEFDEIHTMITRLDDNLYQVNALTEIEEFNDYFDCYIDDSEADTIGGLIVNALEHVPGSGETIDLEGFTFSVTQADRRRVLSLEVSRINA
ncbi:MAG: HlyC/CorC family transporter [Francisellaceae bacterium]